MSIELPPLPYADDALAPHISEETIGFHYGKHHASYVANLNKMLAPGADSTGTGSDDSLTDIILGSGGAMFNNAAQIWNHTFYWNSMDPKGGGEPEGDVADAIASAFGSYSKFRDEFTTAAMTQFGSGWAWLVHDGSGLSIMQTANADLPMKHSAQALLTIDVWEHAYYIDFRNSRPDYVNTFLDHLVNWDHVSAQLSTVEAGTV
jgi:Fe-Mn family superoxide dismutase